MTLRRSLAGLTLLSWSALLVAALVLGFRTSDFSDLKSVVATGSVDRVEVSGGLAAGERGAEVAEVRWERGLVNFSTRVVEERPRGAAGPDVREDEDVTAVLDGTVAETLEDVEPGVEVTAVDPPPGGPVVLGWAAPWWADVLVLLTVGATLALLVTGPRPRRASRWGWCWLMVLTPPVGIPGYLLLSGVLSRRPEVPGSDWPGLTGGKAFVLAAVALGLWASARVNDVFN